MHRLSLFVRARRLALSLSVLASACAAPDVGEPPAVGEVSAAVTATITGTCSYTARSCSEYYLNEGACGNSCGSGSVRVTVSSTDLSGLSAACTGQADASSELTPSDGAPACDGSSSVVTSNVVLQYGSSSFVVAGPGTTSGVTPNYLDVGVGGRLTQIATASDGTVVGVNAANQIYRYSSATGWTQLPGLLVQVSAGSAKQIWGVNGNDDIFRYNPTANGWSQIPGKLINVSVNAFGAVWGVNRANAIFEYVPSSNGWTNIPGALKQISVANDGTVVGVAKDGRIFMYNASGWTQLPGGLTEVSAVSATLLYGVNSAQNLFVYDGTGWTYLPPRGISSYAYVAASISGHLWALDPANNIFQVLD
jgi:hypothetical protein